MLVQKTTEMYLFHRPIFFWGGVKIRQEAPGSEFQSNCFAVLKSNPQHTKSWKPN